MVSVLVLLFQLRVWLNLLEFLSRLLHTGQQYLYQGQSLPGDRHGGKPDVGDSSGADSPLFCKRTFETLPL